MSTRAIRRAAERQARKAQRAELRAPGNQTNQMNLGGALETAAVSAPGSFDARRATTAVATATRYSESVAPSISEARLAANQANAQLSTGPKTEPGKAKSRLNAVKTGLTGRTVLLPTDDVEVYNHHVQIFTDEYQPVGPFESELVQAIADHFWRLNRIASLEHALYAYGFEQFSEQFADRGNMQASFTQMHTFLHYEKQFRNLQTQEMRIRRNREKDTAELRRLQSERQEKERLEKNACQPATPAEADNSAIGFDFSSGVECVDADSLPAHVPDHVAADRLVSRAAKLRLVNTGE